MPGGSGGGIPGKGGCAGLAFWRFFSGRRLAIRAARPSRAGRHQLGGFEKVPLVSVRVTAN